MAKKINARTQEPQSVLGCLSHCMLLEQQSYFLRGQQGKKGWIPLAQDVLEKVGGNEREKEISKVSYVKVKIGEARVADPPEFMEIFTSISKGSIAEGMKLELEIVPIAGSCQKCNKEFDPKTLSFDCPHCGSTNISVSQGKELIIENIR